MSADTNMLLYLSIIGLFALLKALNGSASSKAIDEEIDEKRPEAEPIKMLEAGETWTPSVNPATGDTMIQGTWADINGNAYGTDDR